MAGELPSAHLSPSPSPRLLDPSSSLLLLSDYEMFGFVSTGQDKSSQNIEDLMEMVKKLQKGPCLLCN